MRRPTLLLLVAFGLLAGGCSRRAESSTGAGMRPAAMTGTSGIDRTSSESPRYHRYDP